MSKKFYQAIGLSFALSWGIAAIAWLAGVKYSGSLGLIVAVIYMLMPALSIIILSKFFWKINISEWGITRPRTHWFFIACIWPILLAFLVIPVSLLFPGIMFSSGMEGIIAKFAGSIPLEKIGEVKEQIALIGPFMPIILIIQSLIAGTTINAVFAFGEELLWRGFLIKELKDLGWIKASLVIGLAWGLWHAPLIVQGHNYPEHPYFGVIMMTIWCILLTPSFIYFTIRTKSVFTAAATHGVLNASCGIAIVWIVGGSDLVTGVTGIAGFIALSIFNVGLFIFNKKSKVKADQLMKDF